MPNGHVVDPFVPERLVLWNGRTAPVLQSGVRADGSLVIPDDPGTVGWWTGGSQAGEAYGHVVVAGHLKICADVLHNYLEKYEIVPYNDLIYIYGEIMYGGHITDDWDRRTNITYLKKLITNQLTATPNLIPYSEKVFFRMLEPSKSNYEEFKNYIEKMPEETPVMFGMHPNAEVNFLMNQTEYIFKCIIDLIGESGGSGGKSDTALKDTVIRLRKETELNTYDLIDLKERMNVLNKGEPQTPFQIVCMQECERMNQLIGVMVSTLVELELGLDGALNMTDAMECTAPRLPDVITILASLYFILGDIDR